METKTLSFYTLGPEFTRLINDFIYEGSYKTAIDVLKSGGMDEHQIRHYFMGGYEFVGDTRDEDGMSLAPKEPYTKEKFAERLLTGLRTNLSGEYDVEILDILCRKLETLDIESEKCIDNLEVLFEYFPKHLISKMLETTILEDNGFSFVESVEDNMFNGVILTDGRIVSCGVQMHMELYPILYRLGLVSDPRWTDCDNSIHITSGQMSGTVANEILNWDLYEGRSNFNKLQFRTILNSYPNIEFYERSNTFMESILNYILDRENMGGKFGNLTFLNEVFPKIRTPKYSRTEIPRVKNCIRTSPKYSMAGLLNSKFDIDENSIKEIEADFEKYKEVVGSFTSFGGKKVIGNELHYFYQEFIEGVNGVCHYRNDTFTYSCSENQGDIVNGKQGNTKLSEKNESLLEEISSELFVKMGREIQLEFVEDNKGKLFIVQFRMLEKSNEYRPFSYDEERIVLKGKSFSKNVERDLTPDDILIVTEDCESEKLIGKKGLIVRNKVEFSHVLALSYSLKIPSMYDVGDDFQLPELFNFDTMGKDGVIVIK